MLAALLVLIPFEMGWLERESAEPRTYRNRTPVWQFVVLVGLMLAWNLWWLRALAPVDRSVAEHLFRWAPSWFLGEGAGDYAKLPRHVTTGALLVLGGVVVPLIEESYFRGYLLPRMPAGLGGWAPLVHVCLFSLYHMFTPWQTPSRIVALVPLGYVVWWKRDVRLGMVQHVLLNSILLVPALFASHS
jgi:membrane protease YdiL (CAAX protease family)